MPARRSNVRRKERTISPELRPMAERLLELHEAHSHAVRTNDEAFYEDGRHEELVNLMPIIDQALGIKPWDDEDEILREALR